MWKTLWIERFNIAAKNLGTVLRRRKSDSALEYLTEIALIVKSNLLSNPINLITGIQQQPLCLKDAVVADVIRNGVTGFPLKLAG